ncbi:hypothetical protein [Paenibacillus taichungensis]|uniref:hypothetical protein n=1 Tax=Paenibacillus taichungensis TaxID=484184 RepID=UPI0039A11F2D
MRGIFWSYMDGRDVGTSVEKAIHQSKRGFHPYLIVADDTVMPIPTKQILSERYPNTPLKGDISVYGALLSNEAAKKELNWKPKHSWRDHV